MNIGQNGLDLIKTFEGCCLTAYMPTPHDVPTIGYGHTKGVVMGTSITKAEADAFLLDDLEWVEHAISVNVTVPLTQNQYDALCSFVYNLGATNFRRSTLLRKINAGDYVGGGNELLRWNKQKGKTLRGLTRRRKAELTLFMTKDQPKAPTSFFEALLAIIMSLINKKD